jgi:hypothetical protein
MANKTKEMYFSRRTMQYDDFSLEPGEMFAPLRRPNDAVLIGVNYIAKVGDYYPHGIEEVAKCVRCGKEFVDESYKAMHDTKCEEAAVAIDEATAAIEQAIASGGQIVNPVNPTGSPVKQEQWAESGSTVG